MSSRITAIDSLRGLMIILMILGHTRLFFLPLTFDPIELGSGSVALYLTRVLTNLCAPIFFFLSGMGMFLLVKSKNNLSLASQELLKRGLIILALDLLYVSWVRFWPGDYYTFLFGILWALGMSMVILSLLIRLPIQWAAGLALVVLLGHNALDYFFSFAYEESLSSFFLMLLHGARTQFELTPTIHIVFVYAVIPWFSVMLLGYVAAHYLLAPTVTSTQRQRMMTYLGLGLIGFFILLRTVIGYGDWVNWSWQSDNILYSFLSLFKITKYPASLQYIAFSIGVGCLLFVMFDRTQTKLAKYLLVFGQTPLFLYIIHAPLINGTSWIWHHIKEKVGYADPLPLSWIYLIWMAFLPLFYFACKWYRPIKMKYKHTILKYI